MKKAIQNMKKDESGVSPIVATLVLIVVAVVGAVAVGTIMGAFSGDVSDQMNSGDVRGSAQTEILISGSTTVQPSSENLAKVYMKENTGIKVNVQGGGSDAGLAAINLKVVDIGAASKLADAVKYPDLIGYQVGGSAVLWITNGVANVITEEDLLAAYGDCAATGVTIGLHGGIPAGTMMFQRSEGSGTEETAAEFVGGAFKTAKSFDASNAAKKEGNAGVLKAVQDTANSIGFVDYGYAVDAKTTKATVAIIGVSTDADVVADGHVAVVDDGDAKPIKDAILAALKGTATFPTKPASSAKELTRPLMYYTNGEPTGIVKDFINFARSPVGVKPVEDTGAFHIISFS